MGTPPTTTSQAPCAFDANITGAVGSGGAFFGCGGAISAGTTGATWHVGIDGGYAFSLTFPGVLTAASAGVTDVTVSIYENDAPHRVWKSEPRACTVTLSDLVTSRNGSFTSLAFHGVGSCRTPLAESEKDAGTSQVTVSSFTVEGHAPAS